MVFDNFVLRTVFKAPDKNIKSVVSFVHTVAIPKNRIVSSGYSIWVIYGLRFEGQRERPSLFYGTKSIRYYICCIFFGFHFSFHYVPYRWKAMAARWWPINVPVRYAMCTWYQYYWLIGGYVPVRILRVILIYWYVRTLGVANYVLRRNFEISNFDSIFF